MMPPAKPKLWMSHEGTLGLLLVLAVIAVYTPVGWAGAVWDDDLLVTHNPVIIGPHGLKEIWTTSAADVCPLTLTTFWLEHALWGLDLRLYHVVNVLFHAACALVLWRVLRGLKMPGAWLGAALWALHPVQVESVAWIAELKNTESGLFFLLSILFFVRWLRNGPVWSYALCIVFAALALAAKSSTVILPAALCLGAWWVEGRWQWRNLLRVAPIAVFSIIATVASIRNVAVLGSVRNEQWIRSVPERLAEAGDAVWFYLGKLVWPHPQMAVYPRWEIDTGSVSAYLPSVAAVILLFLLWLGRESPRVRPAFFAFAYFLAALLPVLGFVDNYIFRYSLVFDHFQYLADMGPLALAAAGLAKAEELERSPASPRLVRVLGAGLLLLFGLMSWQRAWVYQSEETLWNDAIAKNPDCWLGHTILGYDLIQAGNWDGAIGEYQIALAMNPGLPEAYNQLGFAFFQTGHVDLAIEYYERALTGDPAYAEAHANLGNALLQKNKIGASISEFQKALAENPDLAEAHYDLGNALTRIGQADNAITQYRLALADNPKLTAAHSNLAIALAQGGHMDEALLEFQKVVDESPGSALAHNNLGFALFQKGRLDEATREFNEALRIDPNSTDAELNLSKVRAAKTAAPASP
jgi:tetratricopeptide (TPR) repeat protein